MVSPQDPLSVGQDLLDQGDGPAWVPGSPIGAGPGTGWTVLITSRRATGWLATAVPVRPDVVDPAQAQALLSGILAQDRPREMVGAAELCAELGFLPLAVEQAGAYLAQADATPREYLDLLTRYPAAMYQAAAEGGDAAAPSPGSGASPWTGWLTTRWPGRCGKSWAGTRPGHAPACAGRDLHPRPGRPHRSAQAIDAAQDQATRQLADTAPNWDDPAGWPIWRTLLPHIEALADYARVLGTDDHPRP